tara:strand:+ start:241 stop:387 length:147 start_codon:yes stop_codon:yes gene_type:complete
MKYMFFIIVASIAGSFGLASKNIEREIPSNIPVEEIEFLDPIYITAGT